jgi:apoptosis-inducing factor 2
VSKPRVVIAGLGDTGVLTAGRLAPHADVVGISAKTGLVSGQELGMRLSRPRDWAREFWVPFDNFRALDHVRVVHGSLVGIDLEGRNILVHNADGETTAERYDVLVISTGVSNGFWRRPALQSHDDVRADLVAKHERVDGAESVIVIGGGAAAVSSAANIAKVWPDKRIGLYFPGERALVGHHARVWQKIRGQLTDLHVELHPGHRAVLPDGFACDEITSAPVQWSTGQQPTSADAVLWAIGQVRPNTEWLPADLLDDGGFVSVTSNLRVPGQRGVYAIGDVAATDPLRSSARNYAYRVLAHNIRAESTGRSLRRYEPATLRWGSVLGYQPDGLEVFTARGRHFKMPRVLLDRVVIGVIQHRVIYRGMRENAPLG